MSATVLYVLNTRSVGFIEEFEGSWGTGPRAWDFLSNKYFGHGMWEGCRKRPAGQVITELESHPGLEGDEKLVLFFMCRYAYIPLAHLKVAAEACETFGARIPSDDNTNHWSDIGRALREMSETRFSRHARGACLTVTDIEDEWRWNKGAVEKAWSIFKP